jgi:hypothetical protein
LYVGRAVTSIRADTWTETFYKGRVDIVRGLRRFLILLGLVAVMGVAATVNSSVALANGCTPGYFKNHTAPNENTLLTDAFPGANLGAYSGLTLKQALSLQGGPGIDGALQILLRAASAAYLNSTAPITYSGPNTAEIQYSVWYVTNFGARQDIIDYAAFLDAANNADCPNPFPR